MKKITHSIREYVRKKKERENVLCKYVDGQLYYHVEGIWMEEDAFDIAVPIYEYKKETKGDNPDKTRIP